MIPRQLLCTMIVTFAMLLGSHASDANGKMCELGTTLGGGGSDSILIQGGTVVNAHGDQLADVYVENGIIVAVGPNLTVPGNVGRVINAAGKYVMPGGIDPHTHLDMPFMGQVACDDFFSGQSAALAGGTTMHIDFALPSDGSLAQGYRDYRARAVSSVMDYGFHMAVTSWSEQVASDMAQLVTQEGVNSFKFFLAYKGSLMVTDSELIAGIRHCKALGAIPMVHAENGDAVAAGQADVFARGITGPEGHALSRPALLEGEATSRAIRLARFLNAPLYVVHVMSKDALEEIARARLAGQRVVGEPVASGLALDESMMWHPDFKVAAQYVMSPPIRSRDHGVALQDALAGNVLQLVATDHAVFNSTQKAMGRGDFRLIPNGVNGIEERMHIVWDTMVNSGKMRLSDYVRITSTACAQIFNIYPRKGVIAPMSDADIIILDPHKETTISASVHHSRMDTNVYEGWKMKGNIETTISQGKVVWENGQLHVKRGAGRYIPMAAFSPYMYEGLDKQNALLHEASSRRKDTWDNQRCKQP